MGAQPLVSVFTEWPKVVGETLAAHCRPLSLDGTRLVIAVDEPAWATQIRYLETELLARLAAVVEGPPVASIEVRVSPGEDEPETGAERPLKRPEPLSTGIRPPFWYTDNHCDSGR